MCIYIYINIDILFIYMHIYLYLPKYIVMYMHMHFYLPTHICTVIIYALYFYICLNTHIQYSSLCKHTCAQMFVSIHNHACMYTWTYFVSFSLTRVLEGFSFSP